jgi:hypothetical protein
LRRERAATSATSLGRGVASTNGRAENPHSHGKWTDQTASGIALVSR